MKEDFKKIEIKWQNFWEQKKVFNAINNDEEKKYYVLVEFPYPSGNGLHVGHVRSYTALDTIARKRRMQGYNVLFPMGWDAFGSPAEQYAVKHHIHPKDAVRENIKVFKNQIQRLGISFDWDREFSTTDESYYKWTQWQFLKFYEKGLAYKSKKPINWCPECKVGLSNEDSAGGVCERCGTKVVQKEKEQWMLRMRDYAESLLEGLDHNDFQEHIKTAQRNWIGKSVGAQIKFKIDETNDNLTVFTTRPDTIYGVTFMVVAPEHSLIDKYKDKIINYKEVLEYRESAKNKSEFERSELNKDKTGVRLEGLRVINPLNNEKIQIWVSDYVLMNYGTGAIMAVPAHDKRDFEFAKKFNIPIVQVIKKDKNNNKLEEAYEGDGEMINSGILNGINNKNDAINKVLEYLETNDLGEKKVDYRLQDWIFSRQRFWGEPIPMIHCEHCGWVAVPEDDLPVVLPDITNYEPTDNGESPLALIDEWVNVKCPKCGDAAKRETDTMPNWAGSSWYWLRYMDSHNDKEFVSKDALNYWGMVDWYNGGMEHATRHLLYARFWNQFLYNIGIVPNKEPFKIRTAHGMILGEDGEKVSKSKGTGANPIDVINEYSADTLRMFEMFIGDYEKDAVWNMDGLKGCKRFIERVCRLQEKLNDEKGYTKEIIVNKTIKKVSEDLENMKFNTAVSSLMIMCNEYESLESITKEDYRILLLLLNPIAPHITEELNERNNLGEAFCYSKWPEYDEEKIADDEVTIGIQVNGKLRGSIKINSTMSEDEIKSLATDDLNVKKYIEGKEIVKFIIVPKRIVSIIIK